MGDLKEMIKRNQVPLAPIPTDVEARLDALPGVRAVLFDVYGTLLISGSGDVGTATATNRAEALTQAMVVAGFAGDLDQAGLLGVEMLKTEILAWHKAGKDAGADVPEVEITKVWKSILARMCNTETLTTPKVDLDLIRRLAIEYECRVNPVAPMPHVEETLRAIRSDGTVMGIVSNAQFYTPLFFSALLGDDLESLGFDLACCIWSFKELKAKPSAFLFPKALKTLEGKYGITPSETVYIGNDMLNDIYCAKTAGCRTVLFAGDRRSLRLRDTDERCANVRPDAIVTTLNQLLEII